MGIYKCQLEFINCTVTDKKTRKKKSKSSIVYIVKKKNKQKPTNRKPQNKMETKKVRIDSFPGMKTWVFVNSGNFFLYVIN